MMLFISYTKPLIKSPDGPATYKKTQKNNNFAGDARVVIQIQIIPRDEQFDTFLFRFLFSTCEWNMLFG